MIHYNCDCCKKEWTEAQIGRWTVTIGPPAGHPEFNLMPAPPMQPMQGSLDVCDLCAQRAGLQRGNLADMPLGIETPAPTSPAGVPLKNSLWVEYAPMDIVFAAIKKRAKEGAQGEDGIRWYV